MSIKHIGTATAVTLAGIVTSLAIGTGTAAAAPSGPSAAAGTIARLQADGNPVTDVPVMQPTTTVHVALNC
jgi:hypothetical protein